MSLSVDTPEETCLWFVQQNGLSVRYGSKKQRTPAVCLAAVQQNGMAVQALTSEQRSPAICLAAVQQNSQALKFLSTEQTTAEVCIAYVQHDGYLVQRLKAEQRSPVVCYAAVQENGWVVSCLSAEQRTPAICLAVIQQDGIVRLSAKEISDCHKWTPELHPHFPTRIRRLVEGALVASSTMLPLEIAVGVARRIPRYPNAFKTVGFKKGYLVSKYNIL